MVKSLLCLVIVAAVATAKKRTAGFTVLVQQPHKPPSTAEYRTDSSKGLCDVATATIASLPEGTVRSAEDGDGQARDDAPAGTPSFRDKRTPIGTDRFFKSSPLSTSLGHAYRATHTERQGGSLAANHADDTAHMDTTGGKKGEERGEGRRFFPATNLQHNISLPFIDLQT